MDILTCKNLSYGYEGKVVVSELDFSLEKNSYLSVVGENGAGKSTFIMGLLRLLAPMSGEVVFYDDLRPFEIGYLPQQTNVQRDFPATVYEVVISGRQAQKGLFPFYSRADKNDLDKYLSELDIGSLKSKCYRELSGGQQQRVLLARALMATKKLLILDEPVAGLDPISTNEFYQLIETINTNMNITIIMVSHDVGVATKYASHILHLKAKQLFFGKTTDYIKTDIGRAFLGGNHD
jgi:zinc transport system ATP-binding protein